MSVYAKFASFGNFVNRVLKFVSSQYNGVIPNGEDAPGPFSPNDVLNGEFVSNTNSLLKDYIDAMEAAKLRLGLQTVMLISNRANTYLQASGLNKALIASNPKRCAQVISRAVNLIYTLSALIYPFMPATSESILNQLNAPARVVPEVLSNDILAGHAIGTPQHLFKKIEENMADVWRSRFGGNEAAADVKAAPVSKKKPGKKGAGPSTTIDGPKSAEVLALETKVAEQGKIVRELKGISPKTPELEEQIKAAVDVLKALKADIEKALSRS